MLVAEKFPGRRDGHLANPFDVDENTHDLNQRYPPIAPKGNGPLLEFDAENCHYQSTATDISKDPQSDASGLGSKLVWAKRTSVRLQHRKPLAPTTFEPPAVSQKPTAQEKEKRQGPLPTVVSAGDQADNSSWGLAKVNSSSNHPLIDVEPDGSLHDQVRKHLAGQFEWLITYPAPSCVAKHGNFRPHNSGCEPTRKAGETLFGCTLLSRRTRTSSNLFIGGQPVADCYDLLATPLEQGHADHLVQLTSVDQDSASNMACIQGSAFLQTPGGCPGKGEAGEQELSPSTAQSSARSDILISQPSCAGSFSYARIEDSLEELDKLEDQLEAIAAATRSKKGSTPGQRESIRSGQGLSSEKKERSAKWVTIAPRQSATVRIRSSEKARPDLRRSNSLTFHDKKQARDHSQEQKAVIPLIQVKASATRAPNLRTPGKSSKPPTIPHFELPGEAVARRLKEQREARQAQQAEAQKAAVVPTKIKSSKPLTKPNFELPGEAISRRKREERETKLKAQEEEIRKRREFRAKPVTHSAPSTALVRDTATSRARPIKSSRDSSQEQVDGTQMNRLCATLGRSTGASWVAGTMTMPARGRNSLILPPNDAHRTASTSTDASTCGKRSSVSVEDIVHQKARAKEIFTRDNSYASNKERERREREMSTKLARQQAADRSRAATREWAERKRQKEQAQRQRLG